MQKILLRRICSERGSALVTVVALSIILAIAGAGYMTMTGTTVSHEITALDNDKAFHAAESGLLMGTKWLVNQNPPVTTGDLFGSDDPVINGFTVSVSIVASGQGFEVRSTAACAGRLGYDKTISWVATQQTGNNAGTFINNMGVGGQHGVGGGGFNNIWFDGPFHMNTSIVISSVSNGGGSSVKFVNGPVSVFNETGTGNAFNFDKNNPYTTGDWAAYGNGGFNNYDFGIFEHDLSQNSNQGADIDVQMTNVYRHSQDSLYMQDVTYTNVVNLPQSMPVTGNPLKRGTIQFKSDGHAQYSYYDAAGVSQSLDIGLINDKLINAYNDINVLGTVNGVATLKTDAYHNIYPVGDLTYSGFTPASDAVYNNYNNSTNYGIASSNPNMLALVPGKDIVFVPEWVNPAGTNVTVTPTLSKDYLYITATMIAKNGTHYWPLFKSDNPQYSKNDYKYKLRAIGCRTLDTWQEPYFASGVTRAAYFYFDIRLLSGLQAPGVPIFARDNNGNPEWVPILSNWTETNTKA